jgi:hypothetical protein
MDPATLSMIIGGGTALSGLLGGLFSRPKRRDFEANQDLSGLDALEALAARLQDPNFFRNEALQMAAASTPTIDQVLGISRTQGDTSGVRGNQVLQGLTQQGTGQALDFASRARLGALEQAGGLLGMINQSRLGASQFASGLRAQGAGLRSQFDQAMFEGLFSTGATLGLGGMFGLLPGQQNPTQQTTGRLGELVGANRGPSQNPYLSNLMASPLTRFGR